MEVVIQRAFDVDAGGELLASSEGILSEPFALDQVLTVGHGDERNVSAVWFRFDNFEQVIGEVPAFKLVPVSGHESGEVPGAKTTVSVDGEGPDVCRGIEGVFVFQLLSVETLSVMALVTVEILGLAGVEFEGRQPRGYRRVPR